MGTSPAYRASLLYFYSVQSQSALSLPKYICTSSYISCRKFRCLYGEFMGRYGQFDGQISNYKKSKAELLISQGVFTESPTIVKG